MGETISFLNLFRDEGSEPLSLPFDGLRRLGGVFGVSSGGAKIKLAAVCSSVFRGVLEEEGRNLLRQGTAVAVVAVVAVAAVARE